jgi:NitT/TauT family transport system substrate-binding protein
MFRSGIIAGAVLLALGASDDRNVAHAQGASERNTLTIDLLRFAGVIAPYIADERGFAKEAGLTLKRTIARTPSDSLANMVAGRVDLSVINVGSIAQAISQNLPIRIVAPAAYATDDIGLYVKADSPIKTVADLKGKTISLAQLQNSVHAFVLKQLDDAGVDPNSVKFTLVPLTNSAAALRAGTVDAAQINEPFLTDAGASIRPIISNLSGEKWLLAYYLTTEQAAKDKSDALNRFVQVMNRTYSYVQSNPGEMRKAIGGYVGISGPTLEKMILPRLDGDQAAALADAKQQLQLLVKYKIISSAPDLAQYMIK